LITAEENGKIRGQISWKEPQEPTAASRGWLDGSTFGAYLDDVEWGDSWICGEIVLEDVNEEQKLFAVWR